MKNLVLAVVASALSAGTALAADLPARLPVKAPVVAAFNWTGCYLGAGGGYAMWNQNATSYDEGPPKQQNTDTTTGGGRGTFATLQAGCDYQFNLGPGRLVVGAFGDYDFADVAGRFNSPFHFGGNTGVGVERMNSMWAVGGRLGALVSPGHLTYVSGGYTEAGFGRIDLSHIILANRFNGPTSYVDPQTYKGYFIGTGDEFALDILPGLTWKNEYRLSVFDTATVPVREFATGRNFGAVLDTQKWVHSVRAGLTYRFNSQSASAQAAAAPAPQVNWTGCYVGAGGGYGMWNQERTGQFVNPPETFTDTVTHGGRGYFATGQLGCDFQLGSGRSKFVVGLFGDYDHANLTGRLNPPSMDLNVRDDKMSSAWAFGGRLGWEARPGLLAYLSGGYTEATFDGSGLSDLRGPPFAPNPFFAFERKVYNGWFVGGGDEYAVGFAPGLFWKNEYRYSRYNGLLDRPRFLLNGNLAGIGDYSERWTHTVRSELVYRFNWSGLVVAK